MADITMSLDDTLELDAIIEKWSNPDSIITDSDSKFNMSGFYTGTGVLDPKESGTHKIVVNGQELTVKVTDPNTIPNTLVDDFEDGNISEYQNYNVTSATAQTSTVFDGNYSLKVSAQNNVDSGITSTSGLNYPQSGDKVDVWTRFGNADVSVVGYAAQSNKSSPNGYYLSLNIRDGNMSFGIDGRGTEISKSVSLSRSIWYRIRFIWRTNGNLDYELYDQPAKNNPTPKETISITNSSYTSGGIFFKPGKITSNGQSTYYDNMIKGSI